MENQDNQTVSPSAPEPEITYPVSGTAHKLAQTFIFPSQGKFARAQVAAAVHTMAKGIQAGINFEVAKVVQAIYDDLAKQHPDKKVSEWIADRLTERAAGNVTDPK